jgi:hypothetical protein
MPHLSRDKTRSLALLLPLAGLFLLMPPAVLAFGMPRTIGGVPLIVLYIFAVWGFLIVGAAWLARRLGAPLDLDETLPVDPAETEEAPSDRDDAV